MATYAELIASAEQIRQAVIQESVSAPEVGQLFKDVIDYIHLRASAITSLQTALQSEVSRALRAESSLGQGLGALSSRLSRAESDILVLIANDAAEIDISLDAYRDLEVKGLLDPSKKYYIYEE